MSASTSAGRAANISFGWFIVRRFFRGSGRLRPSMGRHWPDSKVSKLDLLPQDEVRTISDLALSREYNVETVELPDNFLGELSFDGGGDSKNLFVGDVGEIGDVGEFTLE